jgi:hypothetical protein
MAVPMVSLRMLRSTAAPTLALPGAASPEVIRG